MTGSQEVVGSNPVFSTAGYGEGLAFSGGYSENGISLAVGFAFGAEVAMYQPVRIQSISLTDRQADKANNSVNGIAMWDVKEIAPGNDGRRRGVVTVTNGNTVIETNIEVFSDDGKMWMSPEYQKEAEKIELNIQ